MPARTLSELAQLCDAVLIGDGQQVVTGAASLQDASGQEVSFLAHPRYERQLESTRAAAVLVDSETPSDRQDLALLRCKDPRRSFSRVILAFADPDRPFERVVDPSAVVDPTAELGEGVAIGPLCVVGPGAMIGSGVRLHPGVVVGPDVVIGRDTEIHPCVVLYAGIQVGERCIVHGGTILGADGFGYEHSGAGWEKVPQCGTVVIEDDVEIGANVTIDRSRFGTTRIGRGVKIDNLVQIGHNVQIGESSMILAQVGIAGSTRVGKSVMLAGQAGVAGHLEIGDGARAGAASKLLKDVPPRTDMFGYPAEPKAKKMRNLAQQARIGDVFDRLRKLEKRLAELEGGAR